MIGFPHCGLWNSRCWHPGRTSFSLSHCSRCVVVPLPDAVLDCLAAQPSVTCGELVFDTCLVSTDFQISGALVFLFKSTVVGWWRWTWDAEAWKPALELDVYRLAMPCNSCNQVGGFLRDFIGCSSIPQGFCQNQLGNLNWCSNYSVLSEACLRISDPEVLLSAMIAMWVFGVEFFDGNGLQMASGIPMIYFPQ